MAITAASSTCPLCIADLRSVQNISLAILQTALSSLIHVCFNRMLWKHELESILLSI